MSLLQLCTTLLLGMIIVLCGGLILRATFASPYGASRVEEIRRLRQEGLAVNQEGEA